MTKTTILSNKSVSVKVVILIVITFMSVCVSFNSNAADGDYLKYAAVFDPQYYADNNPDVVAALGNDPNVLFNHFLVAGMSEGRQGCEDFDVKSYMKRYPDLKALYGDNLKMYYVHYALAGVNEGRDGTPFRFNVPEYISISGDKYVFSQFTNNGVPLYSIAEGMPNYEYTLCPYVVEMIDNAGITPEMVAKEKADKLAIYLANYASYDYARYEGKSYKCNDYSFMANKMAICSDYAREFNALCRIMGLETYIISSDADNHAWNVLIIDGEEYYYDVTWISNWLSYRCGYNPYKSSLLGTSSDVFYADGKHTKTHYNVAISYNFADTHDYRYVSRTYQTELYCAYEKCEIKR